MNIVATAAGRPRTPPRRTQRARPDVAGLAGEVSVLALASPDLGVA
jgi:hypothetical protein